MQEFLGQDTSLAALPQPISSPTLRDSPSQVLTRPDRAVRQPYSYSRSRYALIGIMTAPASRSVREFSRPAPREAYPPAPAEDANEKAPGKPHRRFPRGCRMGTQAPASPPAGAEAAKTRLAELDARVVSGRRSSGWSQRGCCGG